MRNHAEITQRGKKKENHQKYESRSSNQELKQRNKRKGGNSSLFNTLMNYPSQKDKTKTPCFPVEATKQQSIHLDQDGETTSATQQKERSSTHRIEQQK